MKPAEPLRPLVTFLVPVCNGERFLREAVQSAKEQIYAPIEVIIIDDGSSDSTPFIAQQLAADDTRVRVHRQENRGHAASLNVGLALSRGELVAVLDYDDMAAPRRLEAQVPVLSGNPDIAVVGGAVDMIDDAGRRFATVAYPLTVEDSQERLKSASPLVHSAATIRRSVLLQLGGYREIFGVALDLDLWLRIGEQHGIVNVPEVVASYRVRPGQGSSDVVRVAYETAVARASSAARRLGVDDPAPEMLRPDGSLRPDERVLARGIVRYGTWYARMLDRSGNRRAAAEILDICARAARNADDPTLAATVSEAQAQARATGLGAAKAALRRMLSWASGALLVKQLR
jgi:glycosyltransferase involved in cell wall biosynthesis